MCCYSTRLSFQKSILVRFTKLGGLMFTRWVWAPMRPLPLVVTYRSGVPVLPGFSEMIGEDGIPVPTSMLRGGGAVLPGMTSAPAPVV